MDPALPGLTRVHRQNLYMGGGTGWIQTTHSVSGKMTPTKGSVKKKGLREGKKDSSCIQARLQVQGSFWGATAI